MGDTIFSFLSKQPKSTNNDFCSLIREHILLAELTLRFSPRKYQNGIKEITMNVSCHMSNIKFIS